MGIIQHLGRNSIGSRQINIRMRILNLLLGLCSFASADSSIGGYSYENPYDSYGLDQNSGWHPPQQVQRSSLLANVFRTNARQALTDPMMMVGAGGALLNAVYTTTATAGVSKAVVLTNSRVDASNKRIATVETRSSNTCAKVNTLLALTNPTVATSSASNSGVGASSSTTVRSASTNLEVAYYLDQQSSSGSLSGNTYALEHVLYGSGASASDISAASGLAAITKSPAILAQLDSGTTTIKNTALSVHDFNVFRKRVAAAVRTLDDKIRELLAQSSVTC